MSPRISRIRGVFSRVEQHHSRRAGKRTQVTYTYEIRIVDDRRELQITSLRSKQEAGAGHGLPAAAGPRCCVWGL